MKPLKRGKQEAVKTPRLERGNRKEVEGESNSGACGHWSCNLQDGMVAGRTSRNLCPAECSQAPRPLVA